jgi:predicted enzyme related to lactoylglutathione lyase
MLPVVTLYLNSVKLRLVMGVYTFVFGWKLSRWFKTKQFWSVPFVSDSKRRKYLRVVKEDIRKDLGL